MKPLQQVQREITQVGQALAVIEEGLYEALADIQKNGLTAVRTIRHNNNEYSEVRPSPALKQQREFIATLRSLRRHLVALRAEERALASAEELASSPVAKFAPQARKQ